MLFVVFYAVLSKYTKKSDFSDSYAPQINSTGITLCNVYSIWPYDGNVLNGVYVVLVSSVGVIISWAAVCFI